MVLLAATALPNRAELSFGAGLTPSLSAFPGAVPRPLRLRKGKSGSWSDIPSLTPSFAGALDLARELERLRFAGMVGGGEGGVGFRAPFLGAVCERVWRAGAC